ncbi:MAG: hypothetical protein H7Y14_10085, partial [Burkholderiales bacterium]|nr:hypothetical protein [Burkholderiales bacterium]
AGQPLDLHAHTLVYDRIIPDSERHFSQLAADALGIPIHHRAADDYLLYAGHDAHARRFAEPSHEPEGAATCDLLHDQAAHARVALMGWDGDTLLNESPKPYFRTLLRERQLGRLVAGVVRYAASERRVLPRSLFAKRAHAPAQDGYPVWLNPDLERSLGLRDRWRAVQDEPEDPHPLRPYAHRVFGWIDRWSNFFDRFDPGVSRLALEVRHPFLDLRLVDFCLSLPPLPWCVRKEILRASLAGVVPEAVRRRPKTPLGNPGAALLGRDDASWVDEFVATPGLERYIERERIPRAWRAANSRAAWTDLRPLTLNFWLQLQASKHPLETHA